MYEYTARIVAREMARSDEQGRSRRQRSTQSSRRPPWLALLLGGAVALLLVACESASPVAGEGSSGRARGDAIELITDDMAFLPRTLRLPAGKKVPIEVTNDDDIPHDFTIESMEIGTGLIQPGDVATATLTAPASPTEFLCTIHPTMTGRIEPE